MARNTFESDVHSGGSLLAESDNVSVFQCSCGSIHLQVGAVCLTMQADELAEINDVLMRAVGQVGRQVPMSGVSVN